MDVAITNNNNNLVNNLCATDAASIVRDVKENYTGQSAESGYKLLKVKFRNEKHIKIETDEDIFLKNYKRRFENLHRGYFTAGHIKLKPIGEVETNSNYLIFDNLKLLPRNSDGKSKAPVLNDDKSKLEAQDDSDVKGTSHCRLKMAILRRIEHHEKVGDRIRKKHHDSMKGQIKESFDMIAAVKAGHVYTEYLQDCQQRRLRESQPYTDKRAMTIQNMSNYSIPYSEPTVVPAGKDAISKRMAAIGVVAGATNKQKHHIKNIRLKKERDTISKLKGIFKILCMLNNMRSKDLRSRVPLSADVMEQLSREPQDRFRHRRESQAPEYSVKANSSRLSTMSNEALQQTRGLHSSVGSSPHATLSHHSAGSSAPKSSVLDGAAKQSSGHPTDSTVGKKRTRMQNLLLHAAAVNKPLLQTWDDLLHVYIKSPKQKVKSTNLWNQTGKVTGVLAGIRLMKAKPQEQLDITKPPVLAVDRQDTPWQKLALQERTTRQLHAMLKVSESNKKASIEPEQVVAVLRGEVEEMKTDLAKQALSKLHRRGNDQMVIARHKFGLFETLPPLFEQQKRRLEAVSETIRRMSDRMLAEEDKEQWYKDLIEEARTSYGKDDTEPLEEIIKKLSYFSTTNSKNLLEAKEKLCLLTYSLKATELMDPYTQTGITFLLCTVFNANIEMFQKWIKSRRIPFLTLNM